LSFLEGRYMFSIAWGDVSQRDRTVISSQEVYRRLLFRTPDLDVLKFDILALAAMRSNGTLNKDKLKDLIRLFRPDRDGKFDCQMKYRVASPLFEFSNALTQNNSATYCQVIFRFSIS